MEARHSLLEIETSAEKAQDYLQYLQKVANVVTLFLEDESTPLRSNFQLPELQNVKEATDYLVNIQLASKSAKEYLHYLENMATEIKVCLKKLEKDYRTTSREDESNREDALEAAFHLEDLEETAEAARDYLKYLQTVSSVVQTFLVDPNLQKMPIKGIPQMEDFMPRHLRKTASSEEEKRTHSKPRLIPPPAPSLQVVSNNKTKLPSIQPRRRRQVANQNVGAYLESLKPSSTALTAVTGNNMEYLDTVASSSKESGVATDGGTISRYLDSIDPQQKRKRRYLNMHDLQTINTNGQQPKSPLDYDTPGMPPPRRRSDNNDNYDRAKEAAAAAGMMDIPASTTSNTARRRPSTTQTAEEAYREKMASNDNEIGTNVNALFPNQTTQSQPPPNPWSQANATSSGTATGSPSVTSSPLIGEAQMPSDWMQPKGPMADLFGGGSSASPQRTPPRPNEIQRPTQGDARVGNGASKGPMTNEDVSTGPPNVARNPRDLLNEVRQLDTLSMKEKNSPRLGRLNTDATTRREGPPSSMPQRGQNVNQRSRPASGYSSNVNDGSSVVGVNDWMQPKGPMAGGSSSYFAPTANNDWMKPKGPMGGASSLPPPQAPRRTRDLGSEAQSLDASQPPPIPPEAYLEQMATPNETIDWSNYNAGSSVMASSLPGPTSADPYYYETPIETVDWSYLDPGKRSPASAAAVAANKQPVSSLDETQFSSSAGQNPWVAPLKEQAALSGSSYQEQGTYFARRRATTLPPVPTSIRSFLDQVKLSTQRGRQIDWSRTRDTKRIRIAPPRPDVSEYYPNPLPQTSQPVDWTSVAEASTIPEPGTGGFLQSNPYVTREKGGQLAEPKYFFLEEPVEDFFFTKLEEPNRFERKAGEPISPKLPILGAKYMEELEQVARHNPLNLEEELEKRRVIEDDELEEPGYFERIFEAGEMINGRLAMFFLMLGLGIEYMTGATLPDQVGAIMAQEWNTYLGPLRDSSQSQKLVQNDAAAKLEKSVHEAGSSRVEQSVQATATKPTPPPPPVVNKEEKDSSKSIEKEQAVQSPKDDVKVQNDEVKTSNLQQPVRDTSPAPSPPVAVPPLGEADQSPRQELSNRPPVERTTETIQPQASVPPAPPVVAEPPITEAAKQQAQPEEPTPTEIKQPTKEAVQATSPAPPVVDMPPPVDASSKSSATALEKDEEEDVSDKPSFPNLQDWSF